MAELESTPGSSNPIPEDTEPLGKRGACSAVYNGKLYMFGGYCGTELLLGLVGNRETVSIFDFIECKWSVVRTRGDFPLVITGACATVIAECLYLFGGWYRGYRYSDIHQLNLETLTWKRLTEDGMTGRPMHKDKAGMVDYGEEMLCVSGGYGYPPDDFVCQHGASYHWDPDFMMELCWTNELHLFHIKKCKWISPELTGPRPPPCGAFSFTRVDGQRAVLFGGRQKEERTNQLHILDMDTWHWSGVILPNSPESPWPPKRSFMWHAPWLTPTTPSSQAPPLSSPQSPVCGVRRHPWLPCPAPDFTMGGGREGCDLDRSCIDQKLLVLWGMDNKSDPVSDAWILNVGNLTWKKVCLPSSCTGPSRIWHTGAAYHPVPQSAMVLAVGGTHHNLFKNEEVRIQNVQRTTLLDFGLSESLFSLCLKLISKEVELFFPCCSISLTPYRRLFGGQAE